jgi:membrane-associated phospholipid phosphatase
MSFLKNIGVSAKYLIFTFCNVAAAFSPGWMPTYYLIGAIMNAVLTKILKVVFNQPRPERSPKQGRGMPSSHASAMAFFLVVMAAKVPSCVPIFDSHAIIAAVGIYVVLAR